MLRKNPRKIISEIPVLPESTFESRDSRAFARNCHLNQCQSITSSPLKMLTMASLDEVLKHSALSAKISNLAWYHFGLILLAIYLLFKLLALLYVAFFDPISKVPGPLKCKLSPVPSGYVRIAGYKAHWVHRLHLQ